VIYSKPGEHTLQGMTPFQKHGSGQNSPWPDKSNPILAALLSVTYETLIQRRTAVNLHQIAQKRKTFLNFGVTEGALLSRRPKESF